MYWGSNRKPGSKSWIFGSPPYFYFLFGLSGPRDGRFCLIFARVAHRLLQNHEIRPYSSKLYAQSRNLRPDPQPEVVWGAIWTKNWVLGISLAFSTPVAMGRSVSIFGAVTYFMDPNIVWKFQHRRWRSSYLLLCGPAGLRIFSRF